MEQKQIEIASIHDAAVNLGRERVVTSLDVTRFKESAKDIFDTGYTLEQLQSCANANEKGLANWFLAYHQGKSPKEILKERFENLEFGFGENDRFMKSQWFSHSEESFWVEGKEEPGYYLLNFAGEEDEYRETRFENITFSEQEKRIAMLSGKVRAPFSLVLESVFSIFDTRGTLLLKKWNHLSDTRTNNGSLLYLGSTDCAVSGKKMVNIFEFPKKHEKEEEYFFGTGAVLMLKKII